MVGKHTGNGCSFHLTSAGILSAISIIAPNILSPLWGK